MAKWRTKVLRTLCCASKVTMDEIARVTGGRAFYGSNDMAAELTGSGRKHGSGGGMEIKLPLSPEDWSAVAQAA